MFWSKAKDKQVSQATLPQRIDHPPDGICRISSRVYGADDCAHADADDQIGFDPERIDYGERANVRQAARATRREHNGGLRWKRPGRGKPCRTREE